VVTSSRLKLNYVFDLKTNAVVVRIELFDTVLICYQTKPSEIRAYFWFYVCSSGILELGSKKIFIIWKIFRLNTAFEWTDNKLKSKYTIKFYSKEKNTISSDGLYIIHVLWLKKRDLSQIPTNNGRKTGPTNPRNNWDFKWPIYPKSITYQICFSFCFGNIKNIYHFIKTGEIKLIARPR